MANKITVYEKPTCTKCREVKNTLTEQGLEFDAINYFEQPLTADLLKKLLKQAGAPPHEAVRRNSCSVRSS